MDSVAQKVKRNKRYLPHEVITKINAVKLYRQTEDISFVCRRYHISKASLMRWNKAYMYRQPVMQEKMGRNFINIPCWRKQQERFLYAYKEQSSWSTIDFVKRAIRYFGYAPAMIQTDNGSEFTHTSKTDRIHPLDVLCAQLNITHKLIRPRTPWHNGKVEPDRNQQNQSIIF